MSEDAPPHNVSFTRSASRHGISQLRALYVLMHHVWAFDVGEGMTLYVGPDREGVDLEVGAVELRSGATCIVHAMKLRRQFRTEYTRRLQSWR